MDTILDDGITRHFSTPLASLALLVDLLGQGDDIHGEQGSRILDSNGMWNPAIDAKQHLANRGDIAGHGRIDQSPGKRPSLRQAFRRLLGERLTDQIDERLGDRPTLGIAALTFDPGTKIGLLGHCLITNKQ